MSRTYNRAILIGNVGKEPELKHTPSGIPVTSFRLATSESWKDKDGKQNEHTDWHTIVAWRGLAEIVDKIVKKGSRVFIEGRINVREISDKNGGRKQVVEILADNILLLDNKRKDDDYDDGYDSYGDEYDSGYDIASGVDYSE